MSITIEEENGVLFLKKGGAGSGNHGHSGRAGVRGGSGGGGGRVYGGVDKTYMEMYKDNPHWQESLTDGETEALFDYGGKGYVRINKSLRKGTKTTPKDARSIKGLDSAIDKSTVKEDTQAYRAIDGVNLDDMDVQVGDVITDNGYMSTTLFKGIPTKFLTEKQGTIMSIEVPEGTNAAYTPLAGMRLYEGELLLPRNTSLLINSITRVGDITRIDAVVVGTGLSKNLNVKYDITNEDLEAPMNTDETIDVEKFLWEIGDFVIVKK